MENSVLQRETHTVPYSLADRPILLHIGFFSASQETSDDDDDDYPFIWTPTKESPRATASNSSMLTTVATRANVQVATEVSKTPTTIAVFASCR